METKPRGPYPTEVTDDEWAFAAACLSLMRGDAPRRAHDLREVVDALRWLVRAGAPWRMLPHDLPPRPAVSQRTRRWVAAGCFDDMVHDLGRCCAGARGAPTTRPR